MNPNKQYTQLEIAKIFGEPRDPRKPYPDLVAAVADTDTAEPKDYYYYFDALQDTDTIHTITSTGELTQVSVTPDTPAALTFADIATPEYYIKITDLASSKESVVARKLVTINRAMNAYEMDTILKLMRAACVASGNQITLSDGGSGVTTFNYSHLVQMKHKIIDYADNYVLIVGSTVDQDIDLWDWNDNKYHSLKDALDALNIEIVRSNALVTIDSSATTVVPATKAYLVGRSTEMGKPILFVRKKLDSIESLGGVIKEADGDKPERLVFASPNPVSVGASNTRYLAIGVTGYEQVAAAVINQYAICEFNRA